MRSFLFLLLVSCGSTPGLGPDGELELLEDENRAPEQVDEGSEAHPEDIVFESGFDIPTLTHWSHARAWVHAPPEAVWEALRQEEVVVDRRVVTSWELNDEGHIPEADFSFALQNQMSMQFANIAFELTWQHQAVEGTVDSPERVVVRWDKTAGPPFIDTLSGSIELFEIEPGVTELSGIAHLRAVRRDAEGLEQYWSDLHADILAVVHDEPLPEYDEEP